MVARFIKISGLCALLALGFTARSEAAEICNETSFIAEVATGWTVDGGVAIEGWTRIRPGECETVAEEVDLSVEQPIFFYAKSSPAYLGGVREWRGTVPLCVDETDFEVVANTRCAALGLASRDFFVREGEDRERTVLAEPSDYGRRAGTAGIQRLLQSAGFPVNGVDGYEGNSTRRAITRFLTDAGIGRDPSDAALMDALEARALERNGSSGLTLCNEADGDISAAVGYRVGTVWQSRGWWRIHAGECARLIGNRLETPSGSEAPAYFYAERVSSSGRRAMTGGDANFCLAPARFVAEERTECGERGYAIAPFRAVPSPEDGGVRITVEESDFEGG
ncbi:DUF1036 domain-containing protein [Maricaulis parjimensis]|uniref:DUF1036 domain-containing protein n=1 Tax=Maricaulis parjimensis TaxID=144023 RepID=UPI0019394D20|nr:DUF1036 domain-containing protein [Maricaulis parjimensis]